MRAGSSAELPGLTRSYPRALQKPGDESPLVRPRVILRPRWTHGYGKVATNTLRCSSEVLISTSVYFYLKLSHHFYYTLFLL